MLWLCTVNSIKRQDSRIISFLEMEKTIYWSAQILEREVWIYPIYRKLSTMIFHWALLTICNEQAAQEEL